MYTTVSENISGYILASQLSNSTSYYLSNIFYPNFRIICIIICLFITIWIQIQQIISKGCLLLFNYCVWSFIINVECLISYGIFIFPRYFIIRFRTNITILNNFWWNTLYFKFNKFLIISYIHYIKHRLSKLFLNFFIWCNKMSCFKIIFITKIFE